MMRISTQPRTWVLRSAFSNAGQRCAAGSRIIVFDAVYDRFRDVLVERTRRLKVGPGNDDDFGRSSTPANSTPC